MIMRKILIGFLAAVLIVCLLVPAAAALSDGMTSAEVKQVTAIYYGKPDNPGKGKPDKEEPPAVDNTHYELLGLELAATATYVINPNGGPAGAIAEVNDAFEAWDVETAVELFTYGGTSGALTGEFDGQNTVGWRGIIPRDIVAMASIWYYKEDADGDGLYEIVEFDITFNALQKWGIDPDDEGRKKLKRMFDAENVATHEVGHVVGLADLYEDEYRQLTMYGYVSRGETQKISLEEGDIAGARYLYGTPVS